ncbi:hypothetical protein ACFODL_11000 [Phenylobacterium terrae]|uniref:Nucleotide exchange factor GrpE n=1 Tax=Phenylobacterium terrae TaxID=2665495 RepID=A0ABW4MZJ7_9CAUL
MPDNRSFDDEPRPDLPPKDADQAQPDAPDEAKLKRHGDDLQSSVDRATGEERR